MILVVREHSSEEKLSVLNPPHGIGSEGNDDR